MQTSTDAAALGTAFAEGLAAKDWSTLESLLGPNVDFRGMTPGQDWAASDPRGVIEVLEQWFEPHDQIERLVTSEVEPISTRHRLSYRFDVHSDRDDEDFVVEQQAYYEVDGDQISWMRVVCSGFLPR